MNTYPDKSTYKTTVTAKLRNQIASFGNADKNYLEDVAIGDAFYDNAKVDGAGEFIIKNGTTPPSITVRKRRVDAILDLVGHMSNLAHEMNMGHSDYESFVDDEKVQNRNYTKLQKLMADIGVKI